MASEAALEKEIKNEFAFLGWTYIHIEPDGIHIPKGWPDGLAIGMNRRVFWLEIKDPSDPYPDPIQLFYIQLLRSMGHRVEVVTTVSAAIAVLEEEERRQ